jgi:ComF family protein
LASGDLGQGIGRGLLAALDALLPPRCLACGGAVRRQGDLCPVCWPRLRFLHPPWCDACGLPLQGETTGPEFCTSCRLEPQPWDKGRAAIAYDEGSRRLILGFKHRERIEAAQSFARWMAVAGAEVLQRAELMLPVPIHRWRLLSRGYNQSALLAARLAEASGIPWHPQLLLRLRATPSQQGLAAQARQANVTARDFGLNSRHAGRVAGRRILLIDDVLTTGATLGACVTVLRQAGASSVDILTLARVVRGGTLPIS